MGHLVTCGDYQPLLDATCAVPYYITVVLEVEQDTPRSLQEAAEDEDSYNEGFFTPS